MIGDLKPYTEYKDSGLPWLGKVPAHWEIKRLGSVFAERGETNELREVTEILSVLKDRGVIPYSEKGRIGNKASDDIGRYKIVRPDDLVVNCMNVIIGSLGRSRFTGCLSPVYYVLRRRDEKHDPRYLELVFQNKQFHESLIRIGNGILAHRMRIPMEKLKSELIPLPPPAEQAAIVRFLDWANGRLERAIRAKRKVIALLNEQKQANIHRAVTRGLDPSIPLKPSGISWIGEIPEHWDVRKIRAVASRVTKGTTPTTLGKQFVNSGVRFVKVESISSNQSILESKCAFIDDATDRLLSRSRLRANDVVVSIAGAIGRPAIIEPSLLPANTNQAVGIISLLAHLCRPEWLSYILASPMCLRAMTDASVQSAQANLSLANLGRTVIPLPPVHEQESILMSLARETAALSRTIARLEREITLLREYRTRLVADVVTGKLDVRQAASRLPDEELLPDLAAADDDADDLPIEDEADA